MKLAETEVVSVVSLTKNGLKLLVFFKGVLSLDIPHQSIDELGPQINLSFGLSLLKLLVLNVADKRRVGSC